MAVTGRCSITRSTGRVEAVPDHDVTANAACLCADTERAMPQVADGSQDGERLDMMEQLRLAVAAKRPFSGIVTAIQPAASVSRANRWPRIAKADTTLCRLLLVMGFLAAVLVNIVPECAAQDVSVAKLPDTGEAYTVSLIFSKDGRLLHEIQLLNPPAAVAVWSVRAITYDATTGSIKHVLNLGPNTWFLSATSDGRTAIISVDRDREDKRAYLLLVDIETGQTQEIPAQWFDADDNNPDATISGDGRIVSAFTESDQKIGELVTLYDWQTKKPVAKQSEGYPAGGFSSGGVTADGKIQFSNNRTGGDVVDPKTGRVLVTVQPHSHRSPDGAWVVEFPNTLYLDAPKEIIIKNGMSGEVVGKLELRIADDEEREKWSWAGGAFCGPAGRFVAAANNTVQVFAIPSGKKVADFPIKSWQDDADPAKTDPTAIVGCSFNGKRVAIRSGTRLTLHDLK